MLIDVKDSCAADILGLIRCGQREIETEGCHGGNAYLCVALEL